MWCRVGSLFNWGTRWPSSKRNSKLTRHWWMPCHVVSLLGVALKSLSKVCKLTNRYKLLKIPILWKGSVANLGQLVLSHQCFVYFGHPMCNTLAILFILAALCVLLRATIPSAKGCAQLCSTCHGLELWHLIREKKAWGNVSVALYVAV